MQQFDVHGGGGEGGLSRYQQQALDGLLQGNSVAEVAADIGLNRSTIYRYLKDPRFMREYRAARRQNTEEAISRLQGMTLKAVEAIGRVLRCGEPSLELRAANAVIDRALGGLNLFDLVEQIEELKRERGVG